MLISPLKRTFFIIAMLLFVISTFLPLAQADQADATTAIASAKEQILICYQAAKDSEEAGANITALVAVLNDAGTLLSRAEFAYSVSDFDTARNLAVQSRDSLNNFISEANTLKEATMQQRNQDFLINVVGSIIGTFAVIVAGFSAWLFLKKKNETGGTHTSESSSV